MRIKISVKISTALWFCGLIFLTAIATAAQTVPAPKDVLGFTPGDDRKLASWAQVVDYFTKLDKASDRVVFQEIGKSTMGAPFVYATISSPENLKNIEKYKNINANLADPRKFAGTRMLPDSKARQFIVDGKTIVLITCGVHSDEVGSYLSSMLIAYKLASANDAETKKILDNTIVLIVPSLNPDGVDIIKNWYDKTLGTKFEGTEPPELYNKYVGHDDNRDWYAFTQIETQLTVDKIHNVWHPQIVNDIHQQGEFGSRLFLPPYMAPVEPNVPKQIVEGYTELGNYMAADLRKQGFQGITTNSTYDAWTPARAYSHYHGGVRILSETASCKLATPITVKFDELRGGEGYDAKKETPNFGPVWKGGEWHLRDITNYMTAAAFSLLHNAADNREKWLTNFYAIGKQAVRTRKNGELKALILLPAKTSAEERNRLFMMDILQRGNTVQTPVDLEKMDSPSIRNYIGLVVPGVSQKKEFKDLALLISMDQPYASFAKAILESQRYQNLLNEKGEPIPPYDVTAHSMSLLMGLQTLELFEPYEPYFGKLATRQLSFEKFKIGNRSIAIYKSSVPSMDEGWTRFLFDHKYLWSEKPNVSSLPNSGLPRLAENKFDTIIFPDQPPNQILNGYAKGSMPDEYTGGVGKEGVENLRKFVEAGGTLVFLNRSSDFAIEQFNLPVKDVTKGLARKDFYIPGSILRTELDVTSPIAKGMPKESIAWFENGPAFEIIDTAKAEPPALAGGTNSFMFNSVAKSGPWASGSWLDKLVSTPGAVPPAYAGGSARVIARYPTDPKAILLSGWALGAEKIAGKAALVQVNIGKGKIILFGFRPQYRGQSLATFPLLFNAISQ